VESAEASLQHAIEGVYAHQRPRLLRFARRLTSDPATAEDAVQQATLRLLSSRRKPRGDIVAYLFACMRNDIINQHRAKLRFDRLRTSFGGGDEPGGAIARCKDCQAVRRAIDSLPMRYREVVLLHHWTELSFREIADAVDEPLFTIASRYRRALTRLEKLLSEKSVGRAAQFRAA
jgi:RNA polymerase sigma-70 factor, ECF subfamily